ncbi:MAG: AI-2E family transporter [Oscillospiraceae bacterium]
MKFRWDKKYLYWGITAFFVILATLASVTLLYNFEKVKGWLSIIFKIIKPFVIGFALAYLLNPIMKYLEEKPLAYISNKKKKPLKKSTVRLISLLCTIIFAFTIVVGLFWLILPQVVVSVKNIISNFETYTANLEAWMLGIVSGSDTIASFVDEFLGNINGGVVEFLKNLVPKLDAVISQVTSGLIGAVVLLKDIFVGIIISIYVLISKERFSAQSKKVLYSIFSIKRTNNIINLTRHSNKVFGGFIVGKIIDSAIIGVICFIGMSIFKMPYALLISTIIGATNVIPFFGPFIGAIPSALLILMIEPLTCLYFCIFVLVLQQFDGNILGPKILGDSTGLSAFWVIFAILVSGQMFGFIGMLVGVPAFAVLYTLIVEYIENNLKKKNLPVSTDKYIDIVTLDDNED